MIVTIRGAGLALRPGRAALLAAGAPEQRGPRSGNSNE